MLEAPRLQRLLDLLDDGPIERHLVFAPVAVATGVSGGMAGIVKFGTAAAIATTFFVAGSLVLMETEPPTDARIQTIADQELELVTDTFTPRISEVPREADPVVVPDEGVVELAQAETPQIDTSGLDVAPVGSELNTAKKEPDPPPPDITGITLEE